MVRMNLELVHGKGKLETHVSELIYGMHKWTLFIEGLLANLEDRI